MKPYVSSATFRSFRVEIVFNNVFGIPCINSDGYLYMDLVAKKKFLSWNTLYFEHHLGTRQCPRQVEQKTARPYYPFLEAVQAIFDAFNFFVDKTRSLNQ